MITPDAGADGGPGGGPYLYFATNTGNSLAGFKLTADGGLEPIDFDSTLAGVQGNFPTSTQPSTVAAHPNGKFLFTAHFGRSLIGAFAVDPPTGKLTRLDVDSVAAGIQDFDLGAGYSGGYVAADPKGRVLYYSDSTGDRIVTLSVDGTTGALAVLQAISLPGVAVRGFAVDSNATFITVVSSLLNPRVVRLPLDPTSGIPLPSPQPDGGGYPSTVLGGSGNCAVVVVDSNGNSYTACAQDQRLHSIGYDASAGDGGRLFSRGSATVGVAPIAVTTHPNGNFAYSASFPGSLRTFAVGADAGPTAVMPPLAINASCRTLAFDPASTTRMFAGCDGKMLTLSVDEVTGLPTLVGSVLRGPDSAYALVVVNPPL